MEDTTKDILSKQILLAEQVIRSANEATFFKEECNHIKFKTEKLASLLLRMVDHAASQFYHRPTHRIIDDSQQVLEKALSLVLKCRSKARIKCTFALVSTTDFRKTCSCLENSIADITWLLQLSLPDDDNFEYLGLPSIASSDPILCLIWEQIAVLNTGSMEDRSDAAASLLMLARDNYRYGKIFSRRERLALC